MRNAEHRMLTLLRVRALLRGMRDRISDKALAAAMRMNERSIRKAAERRKRYTEAVRAEVQAGLDAGDPRVIKEMLAAAELVACSNKPKVTR